MYTVAVLNGDGRLVSYEDGVFTLEGSGQVSPRQLLGWGDAGMLAWEQAGMREWVARRASASPPRTGGQRSPQVAMIVVAAVTAVLLVGGSVFGLLLFQSESRDGSDRYQRLIAPQIERKANAEADFRTLARQHPEVDVDAIVEETEGAQ